MSATGTGYTAVLGAVQALRAQVSASRLPLAVPGREPAEISRQALLHQLDDYVIPRLSALDAPLLCVIGGSTGAGKSTLVNSLVADEVSRSGVLRPTTITPVLVHHPQDVNWFSGTRVLPGLARVTGAEVDAGPHAVRLVRSEVLPPGMALLDTPDIDSVVEANRTLATQLLAAADLWLFVTTAARYADAVPWEFLREASDRGTAVAIVLDRVPREAADDIRAHLASMLREQGLSTAPIFTIAETELISGGRLPDADFARLRSWLSALAGDVRARDVVVRQTLTGALDSLTGRTSALIDASQEQEEAATALLGHAEAAYTAASEAISASMVSGTLLRGEVLARWQEFVGTGEFFKQVESTISRIRDKVTSVVLGRTSTPDDVGSALQSGVETLILAQATTASAGTVRAWQTLPGGPDLLASTPELARPAADLSERIARLVRDWQGDILELIRAEGRDRRTTARVAAYGVNGVGVVLMLVAFAHTGGLVGAEVGIAGGTAVLAQRVLEAIFGDQAVREMAAKARTALLVRVDELYATERVRFDDALSAAGIRSTQVQELTDAAATVRVTR